MNVPTYSEIARELLAALELDPRIDTRSFPIEVQEQEDRLIMHGTVANIAAKKLALRIAQRVCGACPVLDRLHVLASQMEDGQIQAEVVNALMLDPTFADYGIRSRCANDRANDFEVWRVTRSMHNENIDIEVTDGVVLLSGRVGGLSHRRLAEVLVWWTAGCELVENRLRVVPPEKEGDHELSDAIRLVLEKDPLVHSRQISVDVKHGEVTLNGFVASDEERRLAVLDAWYVPGVRDVVDKIQARY